MRRLWGKWLLDWAWAQCMCVFDCWTSRMLRLGKCSVTASSSPTACPLVLLVCKFRPVWFLRCLPELLPPTSSPALWSFVTSSPDCILEHPSSSLASPSVHSIISSRHHLIQPVSQPISTFITSWTSPCFPLQYPLLPLSLSHHSAWTFPLSAFNRSYTPAQKSRTRGKL